MKSALIVKIMNNDIPFEWRPYPKAGSRKGSRQLNGQKRSTAILTDTPIKDQLEKEKIATNAKKISLTKLEES